MANHVLVFAPAPQLTVTVEQPAEAVEIHVHPGGQGVWQARMIIELGPPVVMCAAVGGEIGQVLQALLSAEGIELRAVTREATSGGYVHDRRGGTRTEIADVPGEPLNRHELDELYSLTLAAAMRAQVAVLSGPAEPSMLPADTYRRLAADLGRNGVKVVADLSGDYLSAVLQGQPYLVKASHEELITDGRAKDDSEAELIGALHGLHADGATTVLVSRAGEGALALLDGEAYRVESPRLEVADARGAGDSMTAGVAAVLAQGGDAGTAVRTGAAAGALNVTRHGLGSGRADAVRSLVERVNLKRLDA
ncbi:PfkB family carbohydrate kinase [Phytohabitans sp. ZYX-F-186]|uniref:PfkB family carbohydrate kinase n=1 Tax=Phytohabitans maris TaxID=3071409 RepID=A0ABU0Z9Y5_9ACTN|nr:PfkB family carbohydrate kinase [Phytohabitans sp. ZYX-F-186]MDQ7903137.1 PfkB family carbohydrate kinase [Phytohabitans sp. ZYX-F-186]